MKKFSDKLEKLMDFINFTHEFQEVVRVARPPHRERFENDAEHSYQLAMVAWFLIDQDKLKLNKELCLMYALAHDTVEVYAGDTYTFDKNLNTSKHKREKDALNKIKKRFPNFKNFTKVIEDYEKKADEESKFIYALDKLIPPIQIYSEEGQLWKDMRLSLEEIIENKNHKVALHNEINSYWQELLKEITRNKKKLFSRN